MAASSGSIEDEIPLNVSFGFDDPKYSDRTLLLQIVDGDNDNCSDLVRNVKRRRCHDDHLKTTGPRVKSVHVSSLILAAGSSFSCKLFSNGMLESEQKNVTLQIDASEEASVVNLLNYVYNNKLPTTLNDLLDVLLMADKYEVDSCLRDCTRALQNLPMTSESASIYLDLPPSLLMSPSVEPLIVAAKQLLIEEFEDFHTFEKEMLNLPLASIQTILFSDDLQVNSECDVYDFVITWARKHYPDLEERRGILKDHLLHLIRFPFMTTTKLAEEVLTCTDIDHEVASKIVVHALRFKAETPHQKSCLAAKEAASRQFVERDYECLPINMFELISPYQPCLVYFQFTRDKLRNISPPGQWVSQTFHLGEQELVLICQRKGIMSLKGNTQHFLLTLEVVGSSTCTVSYEIQIKMNPSKEFTSWEEGSLTFTKSHNKEVIGSVPWTEFIEDGSTYFIEDAFHVRGGFTIKKWLAEYDD